VALFGVANVNLAAFSLSTVAFHHLDDTASSTGAVDERENSAFVAAAVQFPERRKMVLFPCWTAEISGLGSCA
jgi:hypothetical protein